jgi:hypothetical protein
MAREFSVLLPIIPMPFTQRGKYQSGVCPQPSPAALQDAEALARTLRGSWPLCRLPRGRSFCAGSQDEQGAEREEDGAVAEGDGRSKACP